LDDTEFVSVIMIGTPALPAHCASSVRSAETP
jgi:hypothetical protein